MVEQV